MAKTRKKIERQEMTRFHNFDKEKTASGKVKEFREINTKYGPGMVIDLVNTETGEGQTVMQTAGLKGYDWNNYIGKEIEIEFIGYNKTDNGVMMQFEVYELE